MILKTRTFFRAIVAVFLFSVISYYLQVVKHINVEDSRLIDRSHGLNLFMLENITNLVAEGKPSSAGVTISLDVLCSQRLFVFCDNEEYQFNFRDIRKRITSEREKGLQKSGNASKSFELFSSQTYNRDLSSGGAERISSDSTADPYFRINEKLQSGKPVSIHVINPQKWLINDWDRFRCPVNACVYSLGDVSEEADVVLVHGVKLDEGLLPPKRWPGQLYVMYGRESPLHYGGALVEETSSWRYAFNLTSTYRQDSDIFWPYGGLKYSDWTANRSPELERKAKNKTRMAAWLVSNCRAPSLRAEYVAEMKKHIEVDIYGHCGSTSDCPGNDKGVCMDSLLENYKFYLAFENSMCPDYITEKFFKVFHRKLNIVPVVRGGADYDRLLPTGSFINAAWFRTAKDLAVYLKTMSDTTYLTYLHNSQKFRESRSLFVLCMVCNAVILQKTAPKIYDIQTWLQQPCPVPKF
ncbi:glycoprotein 3-alpha-L-fucosyltransferase A [Biomphalaria pfeifferi]|uniref:Fucosyltransferase n=1 Tax=Biomphalaria pfeifferi TaxID=112525 RepID=A0AAD8AYN3_BIOPF|nr:glycoprotein 3-alpha-L-fucosyltransferase A [Biomphalaria pfeifferi]